MRLTSVAQEASARDPDKIISTEQAKAPVAEAPSAPPAPSPSVPGAGQPPRKSVLKRSTSVDSLTSTKSVHVSNTVGSMRPGIAKWVVPSAIGVRMALNPTEFSDEEKKEVYYEPKGNL